MFVGVKTCALVVPACVEDERESLAGVVAFLGFGVSVAG